MEAVLQESLDSTVPRTINMVQLGSALTRLSDPSVKALHVYHSNPAVVAPDLTQVLQGLRREDLFTVVHEVVMSETALYADLVLPGATSMESTDLYRSYGHYYLQMANPVIEPLGEARSALAVFRTWRTGSVLTTSVSPNRNRRSSNHSCHPVRLILKGLRWIV